MSRIFGEVRQIAYVVRDLDATMRYWTETLGVGPFYTLRDLVPTDWLYRGQPSPAPHVSIALGYSGDVQVELIQQHDDHPSAYRDLLASGREGFHHVSSWISPAEYDTRVPDLKARGIVPAHEGRLGAGGVRFVYFDTGFGAEGLYFEIADLKETPLYDTMMRIRDVARTWDGRDPVRGRMP